MRRCLGEWALRAGYWVARRRLLRVSGRLGAQRTRGRALQLWADVVCERRAARAFRQTLDEDIWKQRTFEFAQQELAESRVRQGVLQQGLDARQLRPPSPTARQVYADSLGRHAFTQEVTTLHEAFQELAGGHTAGQQARAASGRRGGGGARAGAELAVAAQCLACLMGSPRGGVVGVAADADAARAPAYGRGLGGVPIAHAVAGGQGGAPSLRGRRSACRVCAGASSCPSLAQTERQGR